jgi:hypothetical protein
MRAEIVIVDQMSWHQAVHFEGKREYDACVVGSRAVPRELMKFMRLS